jgi:hypothetical protein
MCLSALWTANRHIVYYLYDIALHHFFLKIHNFLCLEGSDTKKPYNEMATSICPLTERIAQGEQDKDTKKLMAFTYLNMFLHHSFLTNDQIVFMGKGWHGL